MKNFREYRDLVDLKDRIYDRIIKFSFRVSELLKSIAQDDLCKSDIEMRSKQVALLEKGIETYQEVICDISMLLTNWEDDINNE